MAWQKTDEELIFTFTQVSSFFSKFQLAGCRMLIDEIKVSLEKGLESKKIDKNLISAKYKDLQEKFVQEFSTDTHRTDLISFLQNCIRNAMQKNIDEVRRIMNESNVVAIIDRRAGSYNVLTTFRHILSAGAKNDEEKLIGLSYYYLSIVDGIYRNSLRTCYVWQQLSDGETVNTAQILETDVYTIYKYFESRQLPMSYFEGWNSTVRNAVGHSTFRFKSVDNKIIYEDFKSGKSERLSLGELLFLCEKLWNVYEGTLLSTQFDLINDACFALISRYS